MGKFKIGDKCKISSEVYPYYGGDENQIFTIVDILGEGEVFPFVLSNEKYGKDWREYFNEEALIPIEKKQGAYDIVEHVVDEYINRKHKYHFTYLLYGMVITISPYHCAIDMVSGEKSETIYTFDNGGEQLSGEQTYLQVKLMVKKIVNINYGNKVNFAKRT